MARCPSCDYRVYVAEMEEKEQMGTRVKCRHCGYEWTYTGGAKRTPCPNCEEYVNTGKDVAKLKKEEDPFDPMNAPTRPDMTKEEIFDVMAEKLIRNGEKITPGMRELMEMLVEKAAMELGKNGGKEGDGNTDQEERK